jgi:PilZ domain
VEQNRPAISMFGSSANGLHPEQRRSPRFPFDSLVRVTASRRGEEEQVWGRSTDLCREGIGLTATGELTPEELVAMQIPLPSTKPVNVRASVRYCNQARSGFEFVDLRDQQREAIEAACEKLSKASGHE